MSPPAHRAHAGSVSIFRSRSWRWSRSPGRRSGSTAAPASTPRSTRSSRARRRSAGTGAAGPQHHRLPLPAGGALPEPELPAAAGRRRGGERQPRRVDHRRDHGLRPRHGACDHRVRWPAGRQGAGRTGDERHLADRALEHPRWRQSRRARLDRGRAAGGHGRRPTLVGREADGASARGSRSGSAGRLRSRDPAQWRHDSRGRPAARQHGSRQSRA